MATVNTRVQPNTVTNISSTLALTDNANYTLQNRGSQTLYLHEGTNAPALDAPASHVIPPGGYFYFKESSMEDVFVWSPSEALVIVSGG